MSEQIHGHEVMRMMQAVEEPYSTGGLLAAIHERFGEDARFYTCSASDLTAEELIEFLNRRSKFVWEAGDLVILKEGSICED